MNVLSIEEVRRAGIPEDVFDDSYIIEIEEKVWDFIELYCNQWFEPRPMTLQLDGTGEEYIYLPIPAISITDISDETYGSYDMNYIKVYNRRVPDDRKKPIIVYTAGNFIEGYQNTLITGIFGYVDDNGLPPRPLQEAAIKILVLFLEPLVGDVPFESNLERRRLIQEQTDKWMYKFATPPSSGGVTGIPEIDDILFMYRRGDDLIDGVWV